MYNESYTIANVASFYRGLNQKLRDAGKQELVFERRRNTEEYVSNAIQEWSNKGLLKDAPKSEDKDKKPAAAKKPATKAY